MDKTVTRKATRKSSYPCQTNPTDASLHTWRPSVGVGWFLCAGCRQPGYCPLCLAQAGVTTTPNSLHVVPMYCPAHGGASWEG